MLKLSVSALFGILACLSLIAMCQISNRLEGSSNASLVQLADDAQDTGTEVQTPEQQEEQNEEQQGPGAAA